jgi:hypothetical protein
MGLPHARVRFHPLLEDLLEEVLELKLRVGGDEEDERVEGEL